MLEIPQKIWKKIAGYSKPSKVFRTNHENVLCWKTNRKEDRKPVVIKLFERDIIEESAAELKAAQSIHGIDHPNLIKILDVGEDDDIGVYYVMECWGKDLRDTIQIKPDPKIALEIIKQVLEGLGELHKKVGAHRDIKPENIFLKGNQVKIGDYGLVKSQRYVTQLTTIAGTRDYMAPEVLDGKPYDHRCDIYSAGVVLRELISGETPPFTQEYKPPNITHNAFWLVIKKAMAENPDGRFQIVDDFIKALHRVEIIINKPDDLSSADNIRRGADIWSLSDLGEDPLKDYPRTKDTPLTPLDRGDSLGELSASAAKQPIFQKLDIQRYPPKPEMRGQDDPGVLAKTLQTRLDEILRSTQNDKYKIALPVAEELAKAVEKRFGRQNSRTADAIDRLAEIFLNLKNYQEADKYYKQSLELDKAIYGQHSRQYITSLEHLAQLQLEAGDYSKPIDYYLEAFSIVVRGYNEDAIVRNNFAGAHYLRKEYLKAIALYQDALSINEQRVGRISEPVAINLYNMALAYEAMGNKGTAEPLYKQAKDTLAKLPPDKITLSDKDKEQILVK